jgi:hypothetical protein
MSLNLNEIWLNQFLEFLLLLLFNKSVVDEVNIILDPFPKNFNDFVTWIHFIIKDQTRILFEREDQMCQFF